MDYKAVIFDLDGTLVDSVYVWHKVDIDFFEKRNMPVPDNYAEKISALSFDEAAAFTKQHYGFKESAEEIKKEWFEAALFEYANNVRLKEGAAEYIKALKKNGVKIALATASPVELYTAVLKNNGVYDYFDAFASGNEVKRSKEFGDIYILSAERLNVKPWQCLVFEDILRAVKGAKAAGMKVCGVYDKSSLKDIDNIKREADFFIYGFKEML